MLDPYGMGGAVLQELSQVADVVAAVAIPAALLISARQTRLVARQVESDVAARNAQIYQSLHENMAQLVTLSLQYPEYRAIFYEDALLSDAHDVVIAETIAEFTLDVLDTAATLARELPDRLKLPWDGIVVSTYARSGFLQKYWLKVWAEYGDPLKELLPTPRAAEDTRQSFADPRRIHEGDPMS